ncbi:MULTISPECIES: helix-turn-helix domain-containing protein [unclassified Tenacibaculum]|uniref:helix-turn-helix domain-containing protein n=1 Tax=unclassified Tenacibaculum TaxID=2635139 RepID=UPI001F30D6D9|nr:MULTISPECIES: helix-turn-helix domain-containing protein [unclassified Tenacibaculum]MCF2876507.1 helix-turn-helix domain-containing protein [Tenacibaculum sp. Cn5-1]MCF2936586.1 helix-turn-helix domain-containing protein [Tenacibaculum sp. Cn5-34]MCG7511821.1 helix-turn-helix domain-containing protein [Tenacibaculum sp. Cn5-46]
MKELFNFLFYSGFSLCVLLIILILKRLHQHFSNKILIGIFFCLLILFLTYSSYYLEYTNLSFFITPIGTIAPLALGPLLFNYIKSIYNSTIDTKKTVKDLIPFFIGFLLFSIPRYFLPNLSSNYQNNIILLSFIIPFLGYGYFIYYLFLSFKLLKANRKKVKENYSYIKNIDLKWLSIWLYGLIIFVLIDGISGGLLLVYSSLKFVLAFNLLFLTTLIWYIGYYGLNQTQVFLLQREFNKEEKVLKTPVEEKSKIYNFPELKEKLEKLFETDQVFKKQNLSLRETASLLETTDKKLSNYLNTELNTTFYEYVNSYRIQHFKKSISNGTSKNLTLLAIAFDSGFNSKATFNRVFKQQEGITPLQFKKSLEKKVS